MTVGHRRNDRAKLDRLEGDPYRVTAQQRWGIALDDHTSWTA